MVITKNIIIFVVVKEIKSSSNKKSKKKIKIYLDITKKTIIFVLKVGETNKVKKEILNIKNYDNKN